ncbi:MAG: hypothetical protein IJQ76_09130 [Prevotella sp.]|nr:hypothetical protein [Prevotella sp.]
MIKAIKTRQPNSLLTLLGAAAFGLSMLTSCYDYYEKDGEPFTNITAQFSLSVSGKTGTRMTVDATQADQQFKGMQNITLIPFIKSEGTNDDPIVSNDRNIGTHFMLDDLDAFQFTSNSKLYDISMPVGTNSFLVYGRSKAETNGELAVTWGNYHPNDISFEPVQFVSQVTNIGTEENPANGAAGAKGNAIVNYLNTIFNANWADKTQYPVLNGFYEMVENMKAGSSASVLAFIQEIYDGLKKAPSTANGVAAAIAAMEAGATVTDGTYTALPADCQGYPADINLPEGAAVIEWNADSKKFQAVTDKNNLGAMNVDVTRFVKPAELWYRTNSRINTDNGSRRTDYEAQTTWAGVLGTYTEQNSSVKPTTKSVAVRQQMQYAVGRLDVKLKAVNESNATVTSLRDKDNNEFDIANLPIKGILVGQQRPVDFKFEPKSGDSYTIYDSEISSAINANDFTHTLVLETPAAEPVNVAIELLNNDTQKRSIVLDTKVRGENGEVVLEKQIVPYGCRFYLVGQLDYSKAKEVENKPTHTKVFVQDEVTEVTFTVSDLTKGYYVIPPLSSAQLEFSLEVIDWKLSTPFGSKMTSE